ncbi:hypothetical protein GBA52_021788 [Prunus armeniaca]|nr:hypothetical protein GBA52_021788 [Prunus armeniaca]
MGEFIFPKWSLHNLGYPMKMFFQEITDQWREFMKEQIARARIYFNLAEEEVSQLCKASRWPVYTSLHLDTICALKHCY